MLALRRDVDFIEDKARVIRRHIIEMLGAAGSGHPGGSLSSADILAVLYFAVMRHDPANPDWPDRDRFMLSKGHACPVLYAALAEAGYFEINVLKTLRKFGSILQGHPSSKLCPGVEVSSGSLGQGLSVATGMALGARLAGRDSRVYALLGCGEIQEGQIWEASMAAPHFKVDNLCAIMDNNGLQIDGRMEDIMDSRPHAEKWRAFNWNVIELDGHDIAALLDGFDRAAAHKGAPTMIIAGTVKGKGVSFMEDRVGWHGKAPDEAQVRQALDELSCTAT